MTNLLENLEDLYFDELRDLLNACEQKAQAFKQMAAVAESNDLRTQLITESNRTQSLVSGARQILGNDSLERAHHCRGIEGVLRGGLDLVGMMARPMVRDGGIIIAATKAQQYELAGLGTATALAELLGRTEEARFLNEMAVEKKQAEVDFIRTLRTISVTPSIAGE